MQQDSSSDNRIEDGQPVWIKDTTKNTAEAFVKATVESFTETPPSYRVVSGGTKRNVRPVDCAAANPDGMTASDNCFLLHISEATILDNLRQRYANRNIYTYTGSILIAVNPFQMLPIYGHDNMPQYKGWSLGSSEPHSYAMAEEAYKTFIKTKKSQSLVVSGESGSGKTETNKQLMHYIAWRSRSENVVDNLAENILKVNPLLEALGNAKTTRNNNSSRFGKFLKISMNTRGSVLGAATKQYLLERSRINHQSQGERNYHIFYQTLVGHKGTKKFGLSKGPQSFWYTNQSGLYSVTGIDDAQGFKNTIAAFESIGFATDTQNQLFQIIAGLLHLGNVKFTGEDNAEVDPACKTSIDAVADLLGVPDVAKCLVCRTMVVPEMTTPEGNEKISVRLSPEQSLLARDALAKAIYSKLFEWIVEQINLGLRGQLDPKGNFIGLLDVYGFESFLVNTYEQLCINFANEKLQQFFLRFIFKAEEALYKEECVQWTRIEYQDNQGCIDLIEKSPTGIMRLLDEACKKPNGSDRQFCESVDHTHKRNDFFMEPRASGHKSYTSKEAFVVRHFAGDVCYDGNGFLDKNNDTLHLDFTSRFSASSLPKLAALFKEVKLSALGTPRGTKGQTFNSVSRRFINDLNGLLDDLDKTKAHFIRCIKPNPDLKPNTFQPILVLQQLRCSGTIEAVQLMAYAYPTRIPYPTIYDRYAKLMPDFVQQLEPPLFCEALALALDIPQGSFQLGRSRIFFKAGKGQVMEDLAERDLDEVVPMLLEKIKMWEARKCASAMLQNYCRMWVMKFRFRNQKDAMRKIQHHRRSQMIYVEYRKKHLAWLAKREREEAERRAKEAEERRRVEEEERLRQEEAAAAAAARAKSSTDAAERRVAEAAALQAATAAAEAKAAEARAKADAEKANEAAQSAPTEAMIAKQVAAEMAAAADEVAKAKGFAAPPPKDDLVFTVVLERGNEGLGLDVDHYRKGATIGYISADGVAGKDGRIRVGDMIQGVNGVACVSYDGVINAIRNAGKTVELSLRRKHVSMLLQSKMHMQVGADLQWEEFIFRLYSNRELTFEKTQPPAYNSNIDVRLAHEVRMVDAPNGGGFLEIETASKTYSLRSGDSAVLHAWRRELYELLPYLHVTEVKCGWLYKRGETSNAGFKRRFCMLFSSYRLLYFESEACTKRKGAVDLSVAESVDAMATGKGFGFEISTPGRTWVFAAETQDDMSSWMSTLSMMLGDIKERKKRQAMQQGVTILKEGWADLKDETQEGDGAWEAHWFSLNSSGELKVFRDHEASDDELVMRIVLQDLERVERSKGIDFYDFCIDLIGASKTTRMRPIDRGDMQAWLGVLQTQLSAFTIQTNKGSVITTLHQGWLEKRGDKSPGEGWKRRFFVLSSRQEQQGEDIDVQYFLHYFKSQDQASDTAEGGVIDLGEVDEVRKGDNRDISIVTENRIWQLRSENEPAQETWMKQLMAVCGEAAEITQPVSAPPPTAGDVTSIEVAELKMQVPGADGQACWKTAEFNLQSDGILRWKSDEAWPWDEGFIDIKKALGVWLLGPPGWRRLDIILPEHRWTLAADNDEVLQKWVKLLEDVAPEKPVSEIRNGWMEKKGAVGGGWKLRFFVLLSTHELLYFESDRSPKCKGVIDLKEANTCQRVTNPDYNYEFAFEVISPKRTWILCPDDQHAMQEWMSDIRPLIGAAMMAPSPGLSQPRLEDKGGAVMQRKQSVIAKGSVRSYEADAEGNVTIDAGGEVLKSGWLEKRGELNTAWKRRFFVLTEEDRINELPKMLRYFKDEESFEANRNGSSVEIDENVRVVNGMTHDQSHHQFEVVTPQRIFMLCASSVEERQAWVDALGVDTTESSSLSGTPRGMSDSASSVSSFMASGPLVEVHSGWMKKKKGEGFFSKMQRRYFVLYDNRELHYFEGTSMDNITRKGRIRMATATALKREKPNDKKDFTFKIQVPGRDWILDPTSQSAWEEWESKLRPMLES